jgi:hypothetical protein
MPSDFSKLLILSLVSWRVLTRRTSSGVSRLSIVNPRPEHRVASRLIIRPFWSTNVLGMWLVFRGVGGGVSVSRGPSLSRGIVTGVFVSPPTVRGPMIKARKNPSCTPANLFMSATKAYFEGTGNAAFCPKNPWFGIGGEAAET